MGTSEMGTNEMGGQVRRGTSETGDYRHYPVLTLVTPYH